ncbi:MAG: RnfH family protein [Pseudohongiellaceae bacterium]
MVEIDEMSKIPSIEIEVAYALPEKQELIAFSVKQGTTALAAVLSSGLTTIYPEINIDEVKMGIFSKLLDGKYLPLPKEYVLEHKDRIEIYRPLLIDPKQARLQRAKKASKEKAKRSAK